MAVVLFLITNTYAACAQDCPRENKAGPSFPSTSRTLLGRLVYHDEIRQWFGLRLDHLVCGEREIEVINPDLSDAGWKKHEYVVEGLRGCRIRVSGPLGIPPTGYYSTDIYQVAERIEPAKNCWRQPLLHDYSKARPEPQIQHYTVQMSMRYAARGGSPVHVTIRSGVRELKPWQAYASYYFTGGYVFWLHCDEGFYATSVHAPKAAEADITDGVVGLDPESATQKSPYLSFSYTCRKGSVPE